MNDQPPQRQPKLIVVVAFDPDEEGEMQPAQGYPAEFQSEDRAVRIARTLAQKHPGPGSPSSRATTHPS